MMVTAVLLAGCASEKTSESSPDNDHQDDLMLVLPELTPPDLKGGKLRVVATTSIIGDVVAQVGGDAIELTTLIAPGQDPHGFNPTAQDLTAVTDAHVIIINGWDLEEGLIATLQNVAGDKPLIPISAGIMPLTLEGEHERGDGHADQGVDPHVWLDPHQVVQWVTNLHAIFSALDPANADRYGANADRYRQQVADLITLYDEQLGQIPADGRQLITNHDALGYFARAYDFEVIGTVIPAASTLAEPSASGLADLVAAMTAAGSCTIFTETTANDQLAQAAAAELAHCESVNIVPLYTGSLGMPGSGADTYISMMETNLEAMTAVLP